MRPKAFHCSRQALMAQVAAVRVHGANGVPPLCETKSATLFAAEVNGTHGFHRGESHPPTPPPRPPSPRCQPKSNRCHMSPLLLVCGGSQDVVSVAARARYVSSAMEHDTVLYVEHNLISSDAIWLDVDHITMRTLLYVHTPFCVRRRSVLFPTLA